MEYFVTYYRRTYPNCRKMDAQDVNKVEEQKGKICFSPQNCPDCRSITFIADFHNMVDPYLMCPKGYANICPDYTKCEGKRPYICIQSDCHETRLVEDCRCSLGELTDEEKGVFEKKMAMQSKQSKQFTLDDKPSSFILCLKEEIDLSSVDARIFHKKRVSVHGL